jgi:hypothetical protein
MSLKIRRIRIVNFRGVEALDTDNVTALPQGMPEAGVIIKGGNGLGKSSVLRAIQSALIARDIGADAIRIGETRAEILVDLSEIIAKRVITADGSRLTVTGPDGSVKAKPQTLLAEMLGTAALDPIELFLETDETKRRKIILSALPIRVTPEDLEAWLPDWALADLDAAPGAFDLSSHGLEVCTQIRKFFYDRRTDVNRALKAATQKVESCERDVRQRVSTAPTKAVPKDVAVKALQEAQERSVRLLTLAAAAKDAESRTAGLRERIAKTRVDADLAMSEAATLRVPQEIVDQAKYEVAQKGDIVESLRKAVKDAEKDRDDAFGLWDAMRHRNDTADGLRATESRLREQANEIERTVSAMTATPPGDDEVAAAHQAIETARASVAAAEEHAKLEAARASLHEARAEEKKASDSAGRLTGIVDAMTHEAPSALLKRGDGIPGLSLLDGGDLALDGVTLNGLSGMERLRFAVEVTRRANVRAKFILCDELERLDSKHMVEFVKAATRGDYQLVATRVADGDVVLESIEANDEGAA